MSGHVRVTVRVASPGDAPDIAALHLVSFDGFFLSSLGQRFLGHFYEAMTEIPGGLLYVATVSGSVVGFIGGSLEQVGFYRTLLRRQGYTLALASARAAMRRPMIIPRLLRGRRRAQGHRHTPVGACLMTLGVDPSIEGHGVGGRLVDVFESAVRDAGCPSILLTTDRLDNDRVNAFYLRHGYEMHRTIVTAEGRELNEFIKFMRSDTTKGP